MVQFGIIFNYVESYYLKLPSWKLSDFFVISLPYL